MSRHLKSYITSVSSFCDSFTIDILELFAGMRIFILFHSNISYDHLSIYSNDLSGDTASDS